MKIALPINEDSMSSTICQSFGRAPYFLIYDPAARESMFLDNSASANQGGAGIKAAQTLVDHGISVLITPRCGENAADVIKAANIQMYKTYNDSIVDNIRAYSDKKLDLLYDIHAGFHNHGGK